MREKERQALIGWVVDALEECRYHPVNETVFRNLCKIANFVGAPSAWNRHIEAISPYLPAVPEGMGELEIKLMHDEASEEEVARYLAMKAERAPAMAIYSEKSVASWRSYDREHALRERDIMLAFHESL